MESGKFGNTALNRDLCSRWGLQEKFSACEFCPSAEALKVYPENLFSSCEFMQSLESICRKFCPSKKKICKKNHSLRVITQLNEAQKTDVYAMAQSTFAHYNL